MAGALAVYLAARFLPPAAGLNGSAQAVLGTVLCGMLLWMSEALPLGVVAVLVLALLGTAPGARPGLVFGGFTSPVLFFLIGVLSIGVAVEHSGLANRAGRFLLRRAKGSPTRLYFQMLAGLVGMAFVVPSAITRNIILIPAYQETLKRMGIAGSYRTGRALMLALGVLHTMASSALLTGGMVSMTAATLLGDFSWLRWFGLMALPYYALLILGGTLLWALVARFEPGALPAHACSKAAVFSASEWRVVLTIGATSLLWFTDALHGLSPAIPALFAAAILLFPGVGVVAWKEFEKRISWELMLTVGVSLSLAQALTETGGAAWLGGLIVRSLTNAESHPRIVVTALILMVAVIHLAITNLAACIALLVPLATNVGLEAGLNPMVCGLIVPIVVDAVILYPAQTATVLVAYESGYFDASDVLWFGLAMLALTIVVVLAIILPFWSLMGFRLTPN
ncbi:MAG: anion permease [Deltaproteobacteria bacterium]|nr:anion permease [Deltaproteobacteria bacterium]